MTTPARIQQIPKMLYGTAWKQERTTALCVSAVLAGFRGIDTACQPKHYRQELVGEALKVLEKEHGIQRESLWIQTKFTSLDGQDRSKALPYDPNAPLAEQVQQSFETSLKQLQTTYVDSLVMHSPMQTRRDTAIVWTEFEKLARSGKVRELGISNIYDTELLEWAFNTFHIKPTIIQNRFNAEHNDFSFPTLTLCAKNSAVLQSFWTLTSNPWIHRSPHILKLSSLQNLTPEQAWFKFLIQTDRFGKALITPLNGTTSETNMTLGVSVVESAANEEARTRTQEVMEVEKEFADLLWPIE